MPDETGESETFVLAGCSSETFEVAGCSSEAFVVAGCSAEAAADVVISVVRAGAEVMISEAGAVADVAAGMTLSGVVDAGAPVALGT